MKNKDIERYNLTEEEKKELRHLRNLLRRNKLSIEGRIRFRELVRNGLKK